MFLLHWFLYQISDDTELKAKFREKLLDGEKSQFTYETRQSSIDFCDALMKANVDMTTLLPVKDKQGHEHVFLFHIKDLPSALKHFVFLSHYN